MKKELGIGIVASAILAWSCGTNTTMPTLPTSTPVIEQVPTDLDRKLIGIKILTNGDLIVIGLAYDTNKNGFPDTFDSYLGHVHDDGWLHKHEYVDTTYNSDAGNDT